MNMTTTMKNSFIILLNTTINVTKDNKKIMKATRQQQQNDQNISKLLCI